MPRLSELLEYLAQPAQSHIWLLLDIKLDNGADKVMRLIAETIAAAPQPAKAWEQRIVLGVWAAKFLPLCRKYLPDFAITHITFSTDMSRQYLQAPNVSFNMLQRATLAPITGKRWIRDVKASGRPILSWTVNDANLMRWCIQQDFDGVITDDPKMLNEIANNWDSEKQKLARVTLRQWMTTVWLWCLIFIFGGRFMKKFPETVKQALKLDEAALKRRASVSRSLDT